MYTLDTNAIIYFFKNDASAVSVIEPLVGEGSICYASAITELELFSFSKMSTDEYEAIDELFRTISVIPLDSRIARLAGELRQLYRIEVPDSAIAATALFTGSTLLTRNTRDFRRIPDLKLLPI